jgi:hypothetical protein
MIVDDESKLGTYLASVERGALDYGVYAATITFDSTVGPVEVQVVM